MELERRDGKEENQRIVNGTMKGKQRARKSEGRKWERERKKFKNEERSQARKREGV